ncbi:unnamed protein product [Trifolium pratense]|uniref:Uncharacterized protein n=1 Tax=Trifolium pratense TaxID=57577 RepID=A0ACB0JMG0_TRIPR|nr:unnamed protein product [Trifolium pratense]
MSLDIYESSSPDIPDEDMCDPTSANFEDIPDNTQLALYNPESPEIDMDKIPSENSSAVDPFEAYTEEEFPPLPNKINETQQTKLKKSIYYIDPNNNSIGNPPNPKRNENLEQTGQNSENLSIAQSIKTSHITGKNVKIAPTAPKTTKEAILQARDLLVMGYGLANDRIEQERLLDLLEIFREYTEQGILSKASKIIASQVTNLEIATKQIQNKARDLKKMVTHVVPNMPTNSSQKKQSDNYTQQMQPSRSMASVASKGAFKSNTPQDWMVVGNTANNLKKDNINTNQSKPKSKSIRRIILMQQPGTETEANPLLARNTINSAFTAKGIKGLVVNVVAKTKNNISVTTTEDYSADFFLEEKEVWERIIPHTSAQKDVPWYKVVAHGIPLAAFPNENGMEMIKNEVSTFTKGLNPIGMPHWISTKENRQVKKAGSVAIAFATEAEANKAIRNRLYIAGISVRVTKFFSVAPTTQCDNCQAFGHLSSYCRKQPRCGLCGDRHSTQQHHCNACQAKEDIGSDHLGIQFCVSYEDDLNGGANQERKFYTDKADWNKFTKLISEKSKQDYHLKELCNRMRYRSSEEVYFDVRGPNSEAQILDKAAQELTDCILDAAKISIPITNLARKAKPSWSPELIKLRKEMNRKQKLPKANNQDREIVANYRQIRNKYFEEVKKAKTNHWNSFLEKEDPKSIFKAMAYTKDARNTKIPAIRAADDSTHESFQEKCQVFRSTLFPTPPNTNTPNWDNYEADAWNWPNLIVSELERACSAEIKGYHPKCWKQAKGVILRKSSKPDYSMPKAYRVISLLNYLGKVSERILAKRLSYLAEISQLLDPTQIGGRLTKSPVDTALLLTNEVETNRQIRRVTSTLFLDVKGAFDHVSRNQLLEQMKKIRLPTSLISWVASFLDQRVLQLSFNGETESFKSVETGIPQGSPISPILFLIYIRDQFITQDVRCKSYMGDIAISTKSTSLRKNTKSLEWEAAKIYAKGSQNAIQFDLSKTELMHFTRSKKSGYLVCKAT